MNQYKALVQERADLVAEGRALFERAEKEARELTAEEKARDDEINARLDAVSEGLGREERRRERERSVEALPAAGGARVSEVHDNEAEAPFATLGEQLQAVAAVSTRGVVDRRLLPISAASGMNESIPSEGGFLVQQDFSGSIIDRIYELGSILARATRMPLSGNSNGMKLPYINESSRANGYRWGGVQAYWAHEAATVTASATSLGRLELELNKLFALMYVTQELLDDAPALISWAQRVVPEELRFKAENALINGTGAGEPQGVLVAPCLVSVAKETGQAADTIVKQNIDKMWARMWARSRANAIWMVNQDAEPQLNNMTMVVGVGGVPVYLPAGGLSSSPYGSLFGRPVVPVEYCATVGDKGDIILADWSQYLTIAREVQAASSIHVKFIYDEMTFRWTWRFDGQPMWKAALTPFKGSNTLSPFVTLNERA
ncbi:MAG: phage major capsid protein [Armatimonadetes bacterium]|nr:phage major capsid protein [Armatimonadota bacterium]